MDEAAFDAICNSSFPKLVRQTHAICGKLAEAQDCAQEAFVAIAKRHHPEFDIK